MDNLVHYSMFPIANAIVGDHISMAMDYSPHERQGSSGAASSASGIGRGIMPWAGAWARGMAWT